MNGQLGNGKALVLGKKTGGRKEATYKQMGGKSYFLCFTVHLGPSLDSHSNLDHLVIRK